MKKIRIAIAALGLATAVWGTPLLNAHEADKDGGKEAGKEEHGGWGKEGHERMKKELGLTDDQADKMKAAGKAQMEAMKPLMEKRKLDIDSLRVLVDKKAADKDLTAAIEGIKADQKAVEEQWKKHREAMAALLTPMQQAKSVLMMGEMGEHMMGAWKGGMMGKGGWHKGGHDDDDEHEDHGKGKDKDGDDHKGAGGY
jgi:Spy/CpxP family protein refolding chaperone